MDCTAGKQSRNPQLKIQQLANGIGPQSWCPNIVILIDASSELCECSEDGHSCLRASQMKENDALFDYLNLDCLA
ncbi:hypothetical protein NC652_004685 [Populus alba x Populus x berolinensis]|nr:hypothetical protein NC652_004685 [Populus alba x Populus x berolinensis]